MFEKRFYYLLKIQYLGFRYHGWQKQPDVLTVERMMERTFSYVLDRKNFKLLAAGRTDAKVSAHMTYVELFLDEAPLPSDNFLELLNDNLPQDIRCLEITEVDKSFNVIEAPKRKEYVYLFSFGEKNHPFSAPYMTTIPGVLDLPLMQEAAQLFVGTHDFRNYAYKPKPETQTIGTIDCAEIVMNELYTANFFPSISYLFRVRGKGFKRHQIRLMMGALFDIGQGKMHMEQFIESLDGTRPLKLERIAQASGLLLQNVEL